MQDTESRPHTGVNMYPSSFTPLYAGAPVFVPRSISGQTVQQLQPNPYSPPGIPQAAPICAPPQTHAINIPTSQDDPRYYPQSTQPMALTSVCLSPPPSNGPQTVSSQPVALARVCLSPSASEGPQPVLNTVTFTPWLPQVQPVSRPQLQMHTQPQPPSQASLQHQPHLQCQPYPQHQPGPQHQQPHPQHHQPHQEPLRETEPPPRPQQQQPHPQHHQPHQQPLRQADPQPRPQQQQSRPQHHQPHQQPLRQADPQPRQQQQQPRPHHHQPHQQPLRQADPQPRPQQQQQHQQPTQQADLQPQSQSVYQPHRRVPLPPPSSQAAYYTQKSSPSVTYAGGATLVEVSKTSQVNVRRTMGFGGNSSIRQEQTIYMQSTSYPSLADDCVLPLTEPERQKLLSQFFEVLSLHGAMDVCDNRLLSVFMQLPAPIRRGIKRLGGLKPFLEQAEEFFIVEGDTVSLHQAFEEDISCDTAEWEESRTEDFSMADIMKGPMQLDCSHGSGSPDEDELESAKLMEICSFLTSGYSNGDGYYADYLALYPGKKPPYGDKKQHKGPAKDIGDAMAAQAKIKKNKPLQHASGSSPSTEMTFPKQLVSPSPRMSTGEKCTTKEEEGCHVGTFDDSYEPERVCAAQANQTAFALVPPEGALPRLVSENDVRVLGAGIESGEQAEDRSGVLEASAPGEHPGKSGTGQSEQCVDESVALVEKPQEKPPRRKMASIFSGQSTVEGQNKWIHHLQTLAAARPPDQSLSYSPHDVPDTTCSTTNPPADDLNAAKSTLCSPPSTQEGILEDPSTKIGVAEDSDRVPCSPGDTSTEEDRKYKLQHAKNLVEKSSAGCQDEHHPEVEMELPEVFKAHARSEYSDPISIPEDSSPSVMTGDYEDLVEKISAGCRDEHHLKVETEVCKTHVPSEDSDPIIIPKDSSPSVIADIINDTIAADLQVNPKVNNTCETKEHLISSSLPSDTCDRSSESVAELEGELDGEYDVDGSISSECCLDNNKDPIPVMPSPITDIPGEEVGLCELLSSTGERDLPDLDVHAPDAASNVTEQNLVGFGSATSEKGITAEVIPDSSVTADDPPDRPEESTHSGEVTSYSQSKVPDEKKPGCKVSSDESDVDEESRSLQTEQLDPSLTIATTVALKDGEAKCDDILPEDKKYNAGAPALDVHQEDGMESNDSQQKDLSEDQKTTTEHEQTTTPELALRSEPVFNSTSTSHPNNVHEPDENKPSEDQNEAFPPGTGDEGTLFSLALKYKHRMVLIQEDDDDFSDEEASQFLEENYPPQDDEVDPEDLSQSSPECLFATGQGSNPKDAEQEPTSGDHSESIPSVPGIEETFPPPSKRGGHRIVLVQDDELLSEEWNPEFAKPNHQPQNDDDQRREVSSDSSLECIPTTVQEPDLTDADQRGAASKTQDSAPVKVKNKGVNTNEIRMCTRAVSTKKIVQKNLGTSTEIVTRKNRGVDTPKELEEAYMKKYHDAINRVNILEVTLECERDLITSQKNKHALEIREARDSLQKTKELLWDAERELDLRRRQQTTELKKTTVELREMQGNFSMMKSKLVASDKINSCLSSELESVTRQLLDLESSSAIASAIDKVVPNTDAATDTQELDRVQEHLDKATAERISALAQRAKSAEVKILEMKHRAIEQKITGALTDAEYAYNMYASNSQLSLPEKVNLVTRWTEYQNTAQASISKLQSKYNSLVSMIQSEDKVLDQLPELEGTTLDPFTVPAPKRQSFGPISTIAVPPMQPQQQPFQFSAQPVPTLASVPVPGPVNTSVEGSGDRQQGNGPSPLAVPSGGAARQGRGVRAVGMGRGRRPSASQSCPTRPGHDDQLQQAMNPEILTGHGPELSPSHPTQGTTTQPAEIEGSQYPSQPPSAAEQTDHSIPCGSGQAVPPGFGKSDSGTVPLDGGDAPLADGLKKAVTKSRAERIRNMQRRRCLSKLKSAFSEGPHPPANASNMPSEGHSARKLNLLGGSSFNREHSSSGSVGLPSEGMPGSASLPHRSTTAGVTDPSQQSHCPTSDSSRVSPTINLSDLCPEKWLQEIADAPQSVTSLQANQNPLPEVSQMLYQPFVHQHLPMAENQMHRQTSQQVNQLPVHPPQHSLQSSLPPLMSLQVKPAADLQHRAVSPVSGQSAGWFPPREHMDRPGPPGMIPSRELQPEQLQSQMASATKMPSMNFPQQAGLQVSSDVPFVVHSLRPTAPPARNEAQGDADVHQLGTSQETGKQGSLAFGQEGVVNPCDVQSAECPTPAQRISMEWKAQNVASQQASRPEKVVDTAYEAEGFHPVPSESPPIAASCSPSLETSRPSEPLPDSSGDHISSDPKIMETRPLVEASLPNKVEHQSGGLPAQLKSCDADSQSVNMIPPRPSPASKSHSSLPPRFQASHRVQQQRSKFTFTATPDPVAVGSKSMKEEGMLKKRKMMASADKLKDIKVPNANREQETDEWQTQMSKRKKRALAQQEAELKQAQQQALKARKSRSMDKLIGALAEQFPDAKPKEMLDAVQQVRADHNGSLSGIGFNTIIAESMMYLHGTRREPIQDQFEPPKTQPRKRELPTLQAIKEAGPRQDEPDMCVICQELMNTKSGDIRMLDCGHLFHDECISTWYNSRERTCPTCRCHTLFAEDFPRLQ